MSFLDDPEKLLIQLIPEVDAAAMAIIQIYEDPTIAFKLKGDESPLTLADLQSNTILVGALKKYWPDIPVLSEEGADTFFEDDRPSLYWALDPLDGTKEFLRHNGEFTINVALIKSGVPILGLVFAPALDALYTGWQKLGALGMIEKKAMKRIAGHWHEIQSESGVHHCLRIATSRSHPSSELDKWLSQFSRFESYEVGSSLKFCMIAEGDIDIYPRLAPTCIWDTAAGHAVLSAAGGLVQNLSGDDLRYDAPSKILNPHFIAYANKAIVDSLN